MDISRAFNFILMGDVGKSHIRRSFCTDYNLENPVKLGIEYGYKREIIDGEKILLNLWEAASLASFRSLAKNYYHGATASFLIYDATNRESFENLDQWLEVSRWFFAPNVYLCLVAINTDSSKDVAVSTEEAKKFAEKNGLLFMDVGRAEKPEIEKLIVGAGAEVWKRIKSGEIDEKDLINGVIRVESRTKGIARCF